LFTSFQPHDHQNKIAKYYYATPDLVSILHIKIQRYKFDKLIILKVTKAIDASIEAKKEWAKVPIQDRLQLFLNVADKVWVLKFQDFMNF